MRPLVLMFMLASCGLLNAQTQERKLLDRLLAPDMTLAFPLQTKDYYSGGSSVDLDKNAYVKDFNLFQKFSPKSYDAKSYDAKSFWQGDFHFTTRSAAVKGDTVADKSYATKALPVKDADEAGKSYSRNDRVYPTRESPEKGKTSQNHLDDVYKGKDKGDMNIDQVRDLLNKPKL